MILVGIDPGITGGIAIIDGRRLIALYDMPTVTDTNAKGASKKRPSAPGLAAVLRQHDPALVCIEMVNAMPSQRRGSHGQRTTMGAQSMFNFGRGFGVVEATVQTLGIPTQFVLPKTWKRAAGIRPNSDKEVARTIALRLHPEADLHRKCDIGKADALLIAIFGTQPG